MSRILYLTDRYKISQGYEPAFTKMVNKAGLHRHQIITTDIYNLVDEPLKKKANENTWRFDPEKLPQIEKAFAQRVRSIQPSVIVVSCPAVLGVLSGGDSRLATLEKMRGGVYLYDGITTIVTYPVTAIHRNIDARIISNDDGDQDVQQPYRVPQGYQILQWDWQKVGRFFLGKQRKIPDFRYSICRTVDDCLAARDWLSDCRLISTDIETGNWPPQVTCVGYSGIKADGSVHSFVIPFYDEFATGGCFWDSLEDHAIAWSVVRDINDSPITKTMQNGAYDCSYFIRDRAPARNYLLDSMIMWWSLYMELPKSLDFISSVLLDNYQYWKDDIKGDKVEEVSTRERSMERYWRYNALDCYNTLFNTLYLNKLMSANKPMQINYRDAFVRMLSGLGMSMRGMRADYPRREWHRANLERDRDSALADLRYILCDDDFNINSPPQKASLLYDFMGLRERNARGRYVDMSKPTKGTNAISAGAIPLKMAKSEHPLFRYIIDQMESAMTPDKQISNVCDMYLATDRFRTAFNAVGTETTRFSSKKSNFWDGGNAQNIRKEYRDWIVADENHILLDIDFSQSDDVFVAYESQDPDKIGIIERDLDAHAVNGELFFGKTYEWIIEGKKAKDPAVVHPTLGIRQISKRVVHGCVPGDTEVWTRQGWQRIDSFTAGTDAMTWEPYTRKMKFESADLYEGDHCGLMYDFNCPSIKQSLTPDHNVFTEEHGRTTARHVFGKRVSIPTSGFKDGNEGSLARLQVALMADGSREGNIWRISFKKDRKIERFKSLCHEAGAKFWQVEAKEGYKRFHVEWSNQTKVWNDSLLELPLENRQALVEEAGHWDGDFHGNGIRFFTVDKVQAESFERIAVASGFTTTITKTVASEDSYNPGGIMFVVGLTRKVSRGVRATRWSARLFDGKIYCLLVPSKHFLIRYKGTISVTGNTNFQMAAMTLYVTMGRESVVAAAELLGFADAGQWDQDRLVQLCGQLMLKYRKKYKRLTSKEWYKEIADELAKSGRMVNAFGITRTFLGDPKDNGTQREATAFIGQSDTAGNMNRAMKEIDFGIIEPHFRDGPNPDYGDEPRRMTYDSHGFALHLQVHDNFVAQLNLKHPLWRMAAHNLLYVMNRPIIIKGRTVRVKAEAEIGLRWGKGMIEWDGNIESLDGIVSQLKRKD